MVPLHSVVSFLNGSTFPHRFQGASAGDYPHFKVGDMNTAGNELYLRHAENWITEAQRQRMGARVVPAGAVVFARVGAALAAERRRLVERPSVIDDNMMAAVPRDGLLSEYLHACLTGVRMATRRNDGVVPSANQTIVGTIHVPVVDVAAQQQVVARVAELDDAARVFADRLRDTISLRDALTNSLLGRDVH
jgi:type I restriction enzyme S subunit